MAQQQPQRQSNKPIYDRSRLPRRDAAPAAVTVGRWQPVNQTAENEYLYRLRDARACVEVVLTSGRVLAGVVITAVNIYTLLVVDGARDEQLLFKSCIESIRNKGGSSYAPRLA